MKKLNSLDKIMRILSGNAIFDFWKNTSKLILRNDLKESKMIEEFLISTLGEFETDLKKTHFFLNLLKKIKLMS